MTSLYQGSCSPYPSASKQIFNFTVSGKHQKLGLDCRRRRRYRFNIRLKSSIDTVTPTPPAPSRLVPASQTESDFLRQPAMQCLRVTLVSNASVAGTRALAAYQNRQSTSSPLQHHIVLEASQAARTFLFHLALSCTPLFSLSATQ